MKRFVQSSIRINVKAHRILEALTELKHLKLWWGVSDAFIEPKDGGLYTLTWLKSEHGIKFISTGKIGLYNKRNLLELEDLLYINSEKPIIGPCRLRYEIKDEGKYCTLTVEQSGFQKGKDWEWYYNAVQDGWPEALIMLKKYLEA